MRTECGVDEWLHAWVAFSTVCEVDGVFAAPAIACGTERKIRGFVATEVGEERANFYPRGGETIKIHEREEIANYP